MTVEEQLALIQGSVNWYRIRLIDDPCEEVQLAAITSATQAIMYIKNPTPLVQMTAILRHWDMIVHINNPCNDVIQYFLHHNNPIKHKEFWDNAMRHIFDNSVMVNKWIRYGDNIRSLNG